MKIDLSGLYDAELDKYLRDEDKERVREAAEARYGAFSGLSIGVWADCMDGHFASAIGNKRGDVKGTWLQVYWVKGFVEFAKQFPVMLANLSPKMDADEERAAADLMQSTLVESVLVFARSYFGLHSFREAERITLGDVLIAKKAAYNETMFQKRLAKIQIQNAKNKSK